MGNKTSTTVSPVTQSSQQGAPQDPSNKTTPPPAQVLDLEANIQTSSTTAPVATQFALTPEALRRGFVRKVLFILMLQMLVSAIAIGLTFIKGAGIREFLKDCDPLFWTMFGVSMVVIFVMIAKEDAVKKVPYNYILLFTFNICMSYMLAAIAAFSESDIVLFTGGFTCGTVLATALYASFTKTDLTVCKSIFVGFVMTSLLMLVFCLIFQSRFLNVIFSGLVTFLCVLILAFDMKAIIKKYDGKYSLDDYITAALELYFDVVRIFLMALGAARGGRASRN